MSQPHPELLVLLVTIIALAMAPLASRLVRRVGEQISSELYTGDDAAEDRDDEIAQMLEARAYLRGETDPDIEGEMERIRRGQWEGLPPANDAELREEIRQLVIATNERRERAGKSPLDVEAETVRRLAEVLGTNGHSRH
jgi:hypothetical protein